MVCHHWYNIIFSTPATWTEFDIAYGQRGEWERGSPDDILPVVRRWFKRAGDLLLTFNLCVYEEFPTSSTIEFLLSFDRWEKLSLRATADGYWNVWDDLWIRDLLVGAVKVKKTMGRSPLAELRELVMDTASNGCVKIDTSDFKSLIEQAPKLTKLTITDVTVTNVSGLPSILSSSASLIDFKFSGKLSGVVGSLLKDAFSLFPNLIQLSLDYYHLEDYAPDHDTAADTTAIHQHRNEVVEQHKMKTLSLVVNSSFVSEAVWGSLRCPALETLNCKSLLQYPPFSQRVAVGIRDLILSSSCPLTKLTLWNVGIKTEDMLIILIELPTLRFASLQEDHPEIASPWIDGTLFEQLLRRSEASIVLPSLEGIEFCHKTSTPLSANFIKFVEDPKRWPGERGVEEEGVEFTGGHRTQEDGKSVGGFGRYAILKKVLFEGGAGGFGRPVCYRRPGEGSTQPESWADDWAIDNPTWDDSSTVGGWGS